MPVLAVAVGLYLPFDLDSSIFVGGLLAWFLQRGFRKMSVSKELSSKASNSGLLVASGLITGEALMGIMVAILASLEIEIGFVETGALTSGWVGLALLSIIVYYLYNTVKSVSKKG